MSRVGELMNQNKQGIKSSNLLINSESEKKVNLFFEKYNSMNFEIEAKFKMNLNDTLIMYLYEYLSKYANQAKSEYTVTIYNQSSGPSIRRIDYTSNKLSEYQTKQKIEYLSIATNISVACAVETSLSKDEFDKKLSTISQDPIIRKINRTTYIIGNVKIDISKVQTGESNIIKNEIEIERNSAECLPYHFIDMINFMNSFITNRALYTKIQKHVFDTDISRPEDITRKDFTYNYLTNYLVTIKYDGERQLLFYTNDCLYITDARMKTKFPVLFGIVDNNNKKYQNYLFEGERTNDGVFHIFDYIGKNNGSFFNNTELDTIQRLDICTDFVKILKTNSITSYNVNMKKFYSTKNFKSDTVSFPIVCEFAYTKSLELSASSDKIKSDGLIMQPIKVGDKVFKWKPHEQLTIDMRIHNNNLLIKSGEKEIDIRNVIKSVYENQSGENIADKFSDEYIVENNINAQQNQVVEFGVTFQGNKIIFKAIRTRNKDPNGFKTAFNIWKLVNDPISKDVIFGKDMKMVMSYHNSLKNEILEHSFKELSVLGKKIILLDIGSGQGGDIGKWENLAAKYNISKIYAVEPDPLKHAEFEKRINNKNIQKKITLIKSGFEEVDDNIIREATLITGFFSFTFFFDEKTGNMKEQFAKKFEKMSEGALLRGLVLNGDMLNEKFYNNGKKIDVINCGLKGREIDFSFKRIYPNHQIIPYLKGSQFINGSFTESIASYDVMKKRFEKAGFEPSPQSGKLYQENNEPRTKLMTPCLNQYNEYNIYFDFKKKESIIHPDDEKEIEVDIEDMLEQLDDESEEFEEGGESDEDGEGEGEQEPEDVLSLFFETEEVSDDSGNKESMWAPDVYIDNEVIKEINALPPGEIVFVDLNDKTKHIGENGTKILEYLTIPVDKYNIIHAAHIGLALKQNDEVYQRFTQSVRQYEDAIKRKLPADTIEIIRNNMEFYLDKIAYESKKILNSIIDSLDMETFLTLDGGYLAGGYQHFVLGELMKQDVSEDNKIRISSIKELNDMAYKYYIRYLNTNTLTERGILELLSKVMKVNFIIVSVNTENYRNQENKLVKGIAFTPHISYKNQFVSREDFDKSIILYTPGNMMYFPVTQINMNYYKDVPTRTPFRPRIVERNLISMLTREERKTIIDMINRNFDFSKEKEISVDPERYSKDLEYRNKMKKIALRKNNDRVIYIYNKLVDKYGSDALKKIGYMPPSEHYELYKKFIYTLIYTPRYIIDKIDIEGKKTKHLENKKDDELKTYIESLLKDLNIFKTYYSEKIIKLFNAYHQSAGANITYSIITSINRNKYADEIFNDIGTIFVNGLIDHSNIETSKRIYELFGDNIFAQYKSNNAFDKNSRIYQYFRNNPNIKYTTYVTPYGPSNRSQAYKLPGGESIPDVKMLPAPVEQETTIFIKPNMTLEEFINKNESLVVFVDSFKKNVNNKQPVSAKIEVAKLPITLPTKELNPYILFNEIPGREKYTKNLKNFTNNKNQISIHNGQRKLFLAELQYLNEKVGKDEVAFVVYAGAAPSESRYILAQLYPNIKFIMVDPAEFNIQYAEDNINYKSTTSYDLSNPIHQKVVYLKEIDKNSKGAVGVGKLAKLGADKHKNVIVPDFDSADLVNTIVNSSANMFIIEDFYTVSISERLKGIRAYGKVHFWSDIRTNSGEEHPIDFDILWNNSQQFMWIDALKPNSAMLKFRTIWFNEDDNTLDMFNYKEHLEKFADYKNSLVKNKNYPDLINEYIKSRDITRTNVEDRYMYCYDGDIYLQTWAPVSSTETRLWVNFDKFTNGEPVFKKYSIADYEDAFFYLNNRIRNDKVYFKNDNADKSLFFDHCIDCARENKLFSEYLIKQGITNSDDISKTVKTFVKMLNAVTKRNLRMHQHGYLF